MIFIDLPMKNGVFFPMMYVKSPEGNCHTRWYPPSDVCWFIIPLTIVISTISHSYWSYVHQLNAIINQRFKSHDIPIFLWFFLWFFLLFLWFSHDFPMIFLWFSHDFPMIFPWFSHDFFLSHTVVALYQL